MVMLLHIMSISKIGMHSLLYIVTYSIRYTDKFRLTLGPIITISDKIIKNLKKK